MPLSPHERIGWCNMHNEKTFESQVIFTKKWKEFVGSNEYFYFYSLSNPRLSIQMVFMGATSLV